MSMSIGYVRKCFQPRQWFSDDENSPNQNGVLMWVYREGTDGVWLVGYFMPDKSWFQESTYQPGEEGKAAAARRVNYLNGGDGC